MATLTFSSEDNEGVQYAIASNTETSWQVSPLNGEPGVFELYVSNPSANFRDVVKYGDLDELKSFACTTQAQINEKSACEVLGALPKPH